MKVFKVEFSGTSYIACNTDNEEDLQKVTLYYIEEIVDSEDLNLKFFPVESAEDLEADWMLDAIPWGEGDDCIETILENRELTNARDELSEDINYNNLSMEQIKAIRKIIEE